MQICLEGIDKSGKTTFAKNFVEANKSYLFVSEPNNKIKIKYAKDKLYEFCLQRFENIKSFYGLYSDIIIDRSTLSTLSYQTLILNKPLQYIYSYEKMFRKDWKPDVVYYFDFPVELSYKRAIQKREVKSQEIEFWCKLKISYEKAINFLIQKEGWNVQWIGTMKQLESLINS